MKPSERRALEAEKRMQKQAEEREKLFGEKSKKAKEQEQNRKTSENIDTERVNMDATYTKPKEEEIEVVGDGYHRESFFGRNVRTITFIICATLILTVLGPWGIDILVEKSRSQYVDDQVTDKLPLTISGLELLADMGKDITWDDLSNLNCEIIDNTEWIVKEYSIEGTHLVLRVEGESSSKYPEIMRLIHYSSGEFVSDIRKDSIQDMINKYGQPEN